MNLFRLHKFTMVLMPKRKKIVINYIYIIKTARKKNKNNKRTAGTRINFME